MKKKIIKPATMAIILAFSYILSNLINCNIYSNSASATSNTTYQTNLGVNFTLNPSISVSLSSPNLVISDLAPGTISDSNELIITVLSNNSTGYVLNSSVGSSDSPYSSYNRNLINSDIGTGGASNTLFTSLDYSTTPTTTTLTTPSTWGYSYTTPASNDGNGNITWHSWSNYNGLPLYSDSTNIATINSNTGPSAAEGDYTKFKIAAYADTDQLAGEYTNLINFTVVGNAVPLSFYDAFKSAAETDPSITMLNGYYKMQDMSPAICSAVQEEESQTQLIDIRDNNVYAIAKLKDDRCWMTANLDLAGGTQLTSDDTDMDSTWALPTANGFQPDNRLPASSTASFSDDTIAYLYNSNSTTCGENNPCYSYYSWTTATLGSGLNISANNTDTPYSICPKNWRLPTARYSSPFDSSIAIESDLYNLVSSYNLLTNAYGGYADFYNRLGPGTISNFQFSGLYYEGSFIRGGSANFLWSATSYSATKATSANFYAEWITVSSSNDRHSGYSVRCIANNE